MSGGTEPGEFDGEGERTDWRRRFVLTAIARKKSSTLRRQFVHHGAVMNNDVELFTDAELRWMWDSLLARAFTVTEGSAAMFGRTWHFNLPLHGEWFVRTWLWERQTELVVRLGRRDYRGPVGPEHRFGSVNSLGAHLDEALADLDRWTSREDELRCPECGGWLHASEGPDGPFLACGVDVAKTSAQGSTGERVRCSGQVTLASAIRFYD